MGASVAQRTRATARSSGHVRQRKDGDCGVAALAMFLEMTYEDCYHVFAQVDKQCRGGLGLYQKDIIAAAAKCGRKLVRKRKFDLDEDEGVLSVIWPKGSKYRGHYVTLRRGLILDPAIDVTMDHEQWMRLNPCRLGTLLVDAE